MPAAQTTPREIEPGRGLRGAPRCAVVMDSSAGPCEGDSSSRFTVSSLTPPALVLAAPNPNAAARSPTSSPQVLDLNTADVLAVRTRAAVVHLQPRCPRDPRDGPHQPFPSDPRRGPASILRVPTRVGRPLRDRAPARPSHHATEEARPLPSLFVRCWLPDPTVRAVPLHLDSDVPWPVPPSSH
jgi:hypothetical protein